MIELPKTVPEQGSWGTRASCRFMRPKPFVTDAARGVCTRAFPVSHDAGFGPRECGHDNTGELEDKPTMRERLEEHLENEERAGRHALMTISLARTVQRSRGSGLWRMAR